ncbi:Polyamine oxidase, partial [Fusarium oxysporum f. sp. albedinis]
MLCDVYLRPGGLYVCMYVCMYIFRPGGHVCMYVCTGYPASFTIQHTKAQKALYFLEPVTRQRSYVVAAGKNLGKESEAGGAACLQRGKKPIAIGVVDREDVATDATGTVLRYLRRSGSEVPPLDPTKVLSEKPVENPAPNSALTVRAKKEFLQGRV